MRKHLFISVLILLFACNNNAEQSHENNNDSSELEEQKIKDTVDSDTITLTQKNGEKLAQLPLKCMQMEYPNKLDHVMESGSDVREPKLLHPAFYGCFDWHSSVHGHWSLVRLLKLFPELKQKQDIKKKLKENISKEHIQKEAEYFIEEPGKSSERTYGWAWLLKLAEEIHTWDDPIADTLEANLKPLTDVIVGNYKEFIPKLTEPLRVGEHSNTAFALVFGYDYAKTIEDNELRKLIESRARDFYIKDENCPIAYEPSGSDFLSPCLQEVDIMERVLNNEDFEIWLKKFLPQLYQVDFEMEMGEVSDREDGKLVHLDGLNFSRAWVFYDLANKYDDLKHLKKVGNQHLNYSFDSIIEGDSYMGSHWLGSFALYALERQHLN